MLKITLWNFREDYEIFAIFTYSPRIKIFVNTISIIENVDGSYLSNYLFAFTSFVNITKLFSVGEKTKSYTERKVNWNKKGYDIWIDSDILFALVTLA